MRTFITLAGAVCAALVIMVWAPTTALSQDSESSLSADGAQQQLVIMPKGGFGRFTETHLEQDAARKDYEQQQIPIGTMAERVRHVVQSAFDGKRVVIFSGGPAKDDAAVFDEIRAIRDGGGFGSIIGRNSFQRKKSEALEFLGTVMGIYSGEIA